MPAYARTLEELLEFFWTEVGVDGVFCDHPDVAVRVRDFGAEGSIGAIDAGSRRVDSRGKTGLQ